ncbi:histone acetyltransferase [Pseudozyma hubeiensis SY62]|uniref:histone acetyltransferase n=1 Tax=Pseudozyma hubeiensis (strain SY62) TaxID=1305764 RepID=R9P6R4_PSEHS|nr:histone acetyltransferase [Pseudozyma hubeiensis SY62]GAC97051.1 histone acetyltransferase [Pseudozyma hubeiensis SY62]
MPSAIPSSHDHRTGAQSSVLPVGSVCEGIDSKSGESYLATILSRRSGSSSTLAKAEADSDNVQYYIHRHDQDKRMDGWVDCSTVQPASTTSGLDTRPGSVGSTTPLRGVNRSTPPQSIEKGKRKAENDPPTDGSDGSRTPSVSRQASPAVADRVTSHRGRQKAVASSPSDTPALRNIDRVLYGNYDIKTWYYSPYPLDHDDDGPETSTAHSANATLASGRRNQSPSALRTGANVSAAAAKRGARRDSSSGLGGALSGSARDAPAIKSLAASSSSDSITAASGRHSPASPSTISGVGRSKKDPLIPTKMLWICDGCFKYMKTYNGFAAHRKFCRNTHPPGRKVYQRGAHIIWEVDGAAEKLYCQNLSLFGKLFIDHKTIYFDVEPFVFYILTDAANASFDHPLGFFSKEKVSYDDYNLACIVTFPPFQRKSFGTLMIEFSYLLSAGQGMLGTPERPLSDLGLKGYLSFWTAVLLRALISCFDGPLRVASGGSAGRQRRASSAAKPLDDAARSSDTQDKVEDSLRRWHILTQRCKLLGLPIESISHQPGFAELQQLVAEANTSDNAASSAAGSHKRKLRLKGWAGSVPTRTPRRPQQSRSSENGAAADGEGARRSSRVATNGLSTDEGTEVEVHPVLDLSKMDDEGPATMAVTVDDLSRLTHLRADDIVLALREAGLVDAPTTPFLNASDEAVVEHSGAASGGADRATHVNGNRTSRPALLLTRDALLEAISRFNVRPAVLDESYALI